MLRQIRIILERHDDGFVAYPIGLKGIVVGEGDSYDDALADVKSAIQFHIKTFNNSSNTQPNRDISGRLHESP